MSRGAADYHKCARPAPVRPANECIGQTWRRDAQLLPDLSLPPLDLDSLFVGLAPAPFDELLFAPSPEPLSELLSEPFDDSLAATLPAPSDAEVLLAPPPLPSPAPPDLLSLFVSFFVAAVSLDAEPLLDSPLDSLLPATFFLSPDLKSVSYQPPPFNRNATAEIFFLNRSLPHAGHRVSGASDIF